MAKKGSPAGPQTPAKGAREVSGVTVKPILQPVPPPAYTAGRGYPPINLGNFAQVVAVTSAGAVVTAVFITSLQDFAKWMGAFISSGIGILFVSTSPMGTIPSEVGIGMLSSSTGWFWFHALGKMKE